MIFRVGSRSELAPESAEVFGAKASIAAASLWRALGK
jgi:hypothetical protein